MVVSTEVPHLISIFSLIGVLGDDDGEVRMFSQLAFQYA